MQGDYISRKRNATFLGKKVPFRYHAFAFDTKSAKDVIDNVVEIIRQSPKKPNPLSLTRGDVPPPLL